MEQPVGPDEATAVPGKSISHELAIGNDGFLSVTQSSQTPSDEPSVFLQISLLLWNWEFLNSSLLKNLQRSKRHL